MDYLSSSMMFILFLVWLVFSIYAGVLMARIPYTQAKQRFHWTMLILWWYGFAFWVSLIAVIILSFVLVMGKFILIGVLK